MSDSRPNLSSAVCYRDPKAALAFLEKAFGFDLVLLIEDAEGNLAHSEMEYPALGRDDRQRMEREPRARLRSRARTPSPCISS
jgi:uncharacterized glyoxalase superfamily protein PhnB